MLIVLRWYEPSRVVESVNIAHNSIGSLSAMTLIVHSQWPESEDVVIFFYNVELVQSNVSCRLYAHARKCTWYCFSCGMRFYRLESPNPARVAKRRGWDLVTSDGKTHTARKTIPCAFSRTLRYHRTKYKTFFNAIIKVERGLCT